MITEDFKVLVRAMEMTAVHFWAVDIRKLSSSVFQSLNLFVCKLEVVTEKELVVTKGKRGWGGGRRALRHTIICNYNIGWSLGW